MNSITQEMRFRQSLMKYSEKYGVKRASRKYNKSRSYIYFWKARWDGTVESLAEQSKRPYHHPNEHTPDELKLIRDMRRRNPKLGLTELWHRLRKRGYTRRVESLYRVLKRLALLPQAPAKPTYKPKPYEQMTYPGERIQIDVSLSLRAALQIRNRSSINTLLSINFPDFALFMAMRNTALILRLIPLYGLWSGINGVA